MGDFYQGPIACQVQVTYTLCSHMLQGCANAGIMNSSLIAGRSLYRR